MLDIVEVYDTEILLIECADGDVLEMVGSAIIVGGAVASVNNKTGDVVLTAADVNADVAGSAEAVRTMLQPQIDDKADKTIVNQQIDNINQQLPNLATQNYVLTALTPKASIVYVENALATKADELATSTALATKATVTALNQVKSLAESNQLNISTKVEQIDFDSLSANVTTQGLTLLNKADIATLTTLAQLVNTKADQSYVVSEIARITGNAPAALDTLAEIAAQLGNDQTQINNLLNQIGNRVRFDAAQTLTVAQQNQVLSNINAEKAGTAAALVATVTPASIGAATAAQGTKADSALQSGDVAPVALSGSFSDLVNKSGVFNLIYSAYALGSNAVITASDTLGQMLGKLQSQVSANVTAISTKADSANTLSAINTKEPTIAAGTTAQYWRGDKSWRDFATDVRATVLTGLSTATASAIVATDSVLVAIGKAQAQISNNFATAVPVQRRVGSTWYASGRWHDCVYPFLSPSIVNVGANAGVQYFIKIQALESITITSLGVNVSTSSATASTFQIGIYSADANNEPSNLLFKSSALDATTTGAKTASCNVQINAGQVYYLSFVVLTGTGAAFSGIASTALNAIKASSTLSTSHVAFSFSTSVADMPATAGARADSVGNSAVRVCFSV